MSGPADFSYREQAPAGPAPEPQAVDLPPEPPTIGEGVARLTSLDGGGMEVAFNEGGGGDAPPVQPAAAKSLPGASEQETAAFFDEHYPYAAAIAAERGIDPAHLLGLSAYESGWGRSRLAQENKNPFGATPGRPLSFKSPEAAWDWWGKTWGRRVEGTGSDTGAFLDNLQKDNRSAPGAADTFGAYNSENDDWRPNVTRTIGSVQRRLPQWRQQWGPGR